MAFKPRADFDKWLAQDLWSFDEAAQLLFEEEPTADLDKRGGEAWQLSQTLRAATMVDPPTLPFLQHPSRGRVVQPFDVRAWARREGVCAVNRIPLAIDKHDFTTPRAQTARRPRAAATRQEASYLNIIGAMLESMMGKGCAAHPDFSSERQLIAHLSSKYSGFAGVSERTLQDVFARAKGAISS